MSDTVHGNKYELSGQYGPGAQLFIESKVDVAWQRPSPYDPPAPPPPGVLPDPGDLPPGSHLPYNRNPLFTGRAADLLALATRLLPATGEPPAVVIASGSGGVGKTQLAVEFAYRYGRFFHGVHWLSAENPAAIDAAVAVCGRRM